MRRKLVSHPQSVCLDEIQKCTGIEDEGLRIEEMNLPHVPQARFRILHPPSSILNPGERQ
ncbi:MAG TPA: hypothetical protein VEK11_18685 [Thermoanaerobaculia bacterium]|nr:hypothetical protein [Thermoanaerobaculia bacterium]